jgi:hypothetical protein
MVYVGRTLRYKCGASEYTYCNAAWFANMSFNITYRRIIGGMVEYRIKPSVRFLNPFKETKNCNFKIVDSNTIPKIIVFNPTSFTDYRNNRDVYRLLAEKYQCAILGDDNVYKFKEYGFVIPIFKTKQELIKYLNKE